MTRYLALCLLKQHHSDEECVIGEDEQIMSLLEDSYNDFEKSGCHWGMGVVKHMLGKCYLTFTRLSNVIKSSKSDRIFSEKQERSIAKTFFKDAIAHFLKINNFRGIVESGQKLLQLYELALKEKLTLQH